MQGWRKVNALTRVTQYMNTEKKRLILNAFFFYNLIIVPLHGCSIVGSDVKSQDKWIA